MATWDHNKVNKALPDKGANPFLILVPVVVGGVTHHVGC